MKEARFSEPALFEENTYKTRIAALKKRNRPFVYSWREYETDLLPGKARNWVNIFISQYIYIYIYILYICIHTKYRAINKVKVLNVRCLIMNIIIITLPWLPNTNVSTGHRHLVSSEAVLCRDDAQDLFK